MQNNIDILIPYGGRPVWNELKYCLRSIDKYSPNSPITIMSDENIDWVTNVNLVVMPRFYPRDTDHKVFENFYCTVFKLYKYSIEHPGPFLYMHDDMLFLKPFDPEIFDNIALQKIERGDEKQRTDRHGRTINKSVNLLNSVGVNIYNHEVHLPRYFIGTRMRQLYDTFDILNQDLPPAIATLYYNYYNEAPNQVLTERNNLRASFTFEESDCDDGCYIALNEGEIEDLCRDKYICHYSDRGLNFSPWGVPILRNFISNLFPDKCRFEK